jgi:uncharacterized membrane protein
MISLVLFPLLLGGAWLSRPGLHVEIAELGIPVLIMTALTFAFRKRIYPEGSVVIHVARGAWDFWSRSGVRGVVAGSLVFGAIMTLASLRRHWALGSNADDLSIFQGAMWNLTHGDGMFSPQKGTHLFRDHLYFNIYLLAPIFALLPRPETLLAIQGMGLAAGAIPLYYLGRQHAPRAAWIAQAIPLLYWLYLPTRNGNAFDFHPDTLMLPLGLAAIAGLQSVKRTHVAWGALALLLFLGGKESSGVVLTGLGAGWALGAAPPESRERCRRMGFALIPLGVLWFWFETQWIPKHVFGETYAYAFAYAELGSGLGGILTSPFRVPGIFFSRLFGLSRLKFLFWTLGGLAFLPLLGWRAAISSVPAFLMLFLTEGNHRVDLFYYYANEASLSLFWALPIGWQKAADLAKGPRPKFKPTALLAWVLFWCLALSGRSEMYRIRVYSPSEHALWVRHELVPCMSPGIPISATGVLAPHLGNRAWAAAIPRMQAPSGPVECVVIDRTVNPWALTPEQRDAFAAGLISTGFKPVYECQGVQVLSQNTRCMECTPSCLHP